MGTIWAQVRIWVFVPKKAKGQNGAPSEAP